jgi:uncharacterized protein (TIGR03437 family)
MRVFRYLVVASIVVCPALPQTQAGPALAVDAGAARHSISPDIYGLNNYFVDENSPNSSGDADPGEMHPDFGWAGRSADVRIGLRRWGGDIGPRYNWKLDVWNWANDWYYEIHPDSQNLHPELLPDGSRVNLMQEYARVTGGKLLGTVSMLGWLPKIRPSNWPSPCSFAVARYGPQAQADPLDPYHVCGNGVQRDGKTPIQNDPNDVAAPYDEHFQSDWVKYMVARYGKANQGGVAAWSLDNELGAWAITHRDVHPLPQTYDESWDLSLKYAQAIKDADPSALVVSPAQPFWANFFYSTLDFAAAGINFADFASKLGYPSVPYWANPVDRNAHGGVDYTSWYLRKFRDHEQQTGQRLLDYFDLHFAFMLSQPATDAERLRLTRVLWNPEYVATDTYWTRDDQGQPAKPRLIPRMHDWVNQNYPGTKIAITEYDFGAHASIIGALAEADALGIFGREGLDMAAGFFWGTTFAPGDIEQAKTTDPIAFAFRMYRNYDGIGGAFGETSVQATTGDPDQLSVFAAQRSDTALTILVLNKTTGDLSSTVGISNFMPDSKAQVWRYSQANLNSILRQPDADVSGSSLSTTFPAYSITLVVVPASPSVLPVPKPVVNAVVNAASYSADTAPGQMVVVFGSNLGPKQLNSAIVAGSNSVVPTVMGGVRILFDGVPAPMVYVSEHQCAAVVPYLAGLTPVAYVQVEYQGVRSDPVQIAMGTTAPGLFTVNAQGSGQAAIHNEDGLTPNSTNAPARPGSVVVLVGTGEGVTTPSGVDGRLAIDILPKPVATCAAEIGGPAATVEYCGAAPFNMPGLFQINARIDPSVAPGDAVGVRVIIGGKSSQTGTTMVVR